MFSCNTSIKVFCLVFHSRKFCDFSNVTVGEVKLMLYVKVLIPLNRNTS